MKKYIVWAGWVRSPKDGDEHWVTTRELIHLYGVDPRECIEIHKRDDLYKLLGRDTSGLTDLYPDTYGNYAL
jgi:hypothetical protein